MSADKLKRYLFTGVVVLLLIPLLQENFKILPLNPLKGAFEEHKEARFKIKEWFSGEYQQKEDLFLDQVRQLRPFLVRVFNQIDFSLFRIPHAREVVLGKENYLFENAYILNYLGRNFIGEEGINERCAKLKFLQDELKRRNNIDLIIIFSPGKASFYSAYIPDQFEPWRKTQSNYDYYCKRIKEAGLNFMDLNRYFLLMKDTAAYPLYPKYGIHWSVYGMGMSVDTMIHYIEKKRNIKMMTFGWKALDVTDKPRDTDYDVGDGLNLLFKLPCPKYAYPYWVFRDRPGMTKPRVLTIADSFYWTIFGNGIGGMIFDPNTFWFYNNEAYFAHDKPKMVKSLNLKEEYEKNDVIVLMSAESNLHNFPWGFIEDAYKLYFPQSRVERKEHFRKMISLDPGWKNDVAVKAAKEGKNLEKALEEEAEITSTYQDSINAPNEKSVQRIEKIIRIDPKWFDAEKKKATERKISIDTMLRQDALWMIKNERNTYRRRYWP